MMPWDTMVTNIGYLSKYWGIDYIGLLNPNDGGLCFGLTHMWAQAVLLGDEKKFYDRMILLTTDYSVKTPGSKLIDLVRAYETRLRGRIPQDRATLCDHMDEDDLIGSLRTFLENVLAYQSPHSKKLFSSKSTPNMPMLAGVPSGGIRRQTYITSKYTLPAMGDVEGDANFRGLAKLTCEVWYGTTNELSIKLEQLLQDIKRVSVGTNRRVVVTLNSESHIIGISSIDENGMIYIYNQNYMISEFTSPEALLVYCKFWLHVPEQSRDFWLRCTLKNERLSLRKDINLLLTVNVLCLPGWTGGLLSIMRKQNYYNYWERMLAIVNDDNIKDIIEKCCAGGHLKVLETILNNYNIEKQRFLINMNLKSGIPLTIAAEKGDVELFRLCLLYGADLNKRGLFDGTVKQIALKWNDQNILREIAEYERAKKK